LLALAEKQLNHIYTKSRLLQKLFFKIAVVVPGMQLN
jgi:hypothetical protein